MGQTLESDYIYCKGFEACKSAIIVAEQVHLEGLYAANSAIITAKQVASLGYGGGINAVFDTVSSTGVALDEMSLNFRGTGSGLNAIVNCRGAAKCTIMCNDYTGCKGVKIYVTPSSLPKLTLTPSECVNSVNWNTAIDGVLCPELISGF